MNFVCYMCLRTSSMLARLVYVENVMPNCWPTSIYAAIVYRTVQLMNCATMMLMVFDFDFGLLAILNALCSAMPALLAYRATYNHDNDHSIHMAVVDVIVYCVLAYFFHCVSEL